jgi:hypothetical protein
MNFTDELQKLAGLHRDGQLTDREFASAKARLLEREGAHPLESLSAPRPPPPAGSSRRPW